LIDTLQLKTWNKLAKLSWMPFEEAREYARGLNLKNLKAWHIHAKVKRPLDIPYSPHLIYGDSWKGYGDFLGTGIIATKDRKYWPFIKSRDFVRSLGLKNEKQWRSFTKTQSLPITIPAAPQFVYENEWTGIGDWLGTGSIAPHQKIFMSFLNAKKLAKQYNIRSQSEYKLFTKSSNFPKNLPTNPDKSYRNIGWVSWGDFLNTGVVAPGNQKYIDFEIAKKYVRSLNLKTGKEWNEFCNSNMKPANIPASPNYIYKNNGWSGMGDWLGTNRIATVNAVFIGFNKARKHVRKLKLKTINQWKSYCKSGKKPPIIPSNPNRTYAGQGWKNYSDWLGIDTVANSKKSFFSYEEAKQIVRSYKFKNQSEWFKFRKSGKKPKNIPSDPYGVYKNKGWKGWADFIGKER
jgi:hypothetical protein